MGVLQLQEFRAEMQSSLGHRGDITDARKNRYINLAQLRVASVVPWEELQVEEVIALVLNDTSKAFSALTNTNPMQIVSLTLENAADSAKLEYLDIREFTDRFHLSSQWTSGKPSHYSVFKRKFEFWRKADGALNIRARMVAWPVALSTDTAVSTLTEKDDLILAMSLYLMLQSLGMTEDAVAWLGIYQQLLQQALGQETSSVDVSLIKTRDLTIPALSGRNPQVQPGQV